MVSKQHATHYSLQPTCRVVPSNGKKKKIMCLKGSLKPGGSTAVFIYIPRLDETHTVIYLDLRVYKPAPVGTSSLSSLLIVILFAW